MNYLILYFEFFKIGLFSIGGGLATIPFLQDLARKYDWLTLTDLADYIAISESTPGPIGINTATFVGYGSAGIFGGIIAVLGIVTPSIIIITIIAYYFQRFNEKPFIQNGFYTLRPAVVGLIGAAGYEVAKVSLFNIEMFTETQTFISMLDFKAIIFFLIIIYLMKRFKKHPVVYLSLGAIVGIIFNF
ncbi:chromate transporter [Petrotoga olearia]|uniref:Chromate transporter n=2 Tax=Petrotoga olearia TaxID=156203 RepID=A0A2K1P0R4_9BACT|nr:chromate transporter [Petrotoga olearia]PNR96385.1 chromate transporter [Petrotoga olearia DSM 13574]RMA76558.1 chromate transporter [Petrotoga olearia]